MKHHADHTNQAVMPPRGAMIAGTCIAIVMAGSVWSNLLTGHHKAFERSAAPAPVMVEPARPVRSAGAATNTYPSSSVSVSVQQAVPSAAADDPLGQLILQTGSIAPAAPLDNEPVSSTDDAGGGLIIEAQRALAALQYYSGPVDGLVGPAHEEAVRTYQAMNGLPVTGVVTRPVLDHMQMAATVQSAAQTDIVVHRVQSALAKLGYSPGTIDGRMGEQTRQAIRVFEADRGWQVTGQISSELLGELDGTADLASALSN